MKTGLIAAACGFTLLTTVSNAQVPVNIAEKVRAAGQAMDPTVGQLYAPLFPKEAWAGVNIERDIAYGSDPLQKLDVFTPEGPRAAGDYVLAVGTLEPRKNLARIAQAVDGELRVVGARGWGGVAPPSNVTWCEDVSDEELAALYRGARCLVYASLYEGFGIPVAEALACGCAVVTSAGSPMADLAGADAALVDPEDVGSIRDGIARVSPPVARRGPSWAEVAERTRAVYEEVA